MDVPPGVRCEFLLSDVLVKISFDMGIVLWNILVFGPKEKSRRGESVGYVDTEVFKPEQFLFLSITHCSLSLLSALVCNDTNYVSLV